MRTLTDAAAEILNTASPEDKAEMTRRAACDWFAGKMREIGDALPPDRPARPPRPELLPPRDMPQRRIGGAKGRTAMLHALAHIELNAIDLAWDIISRFHDRDLPAAFYDDWVKVAEDEARHYLLLKDRLAAMDCRYGDLPAHGGLWESAQATRDDLLARLAVVPMVLEARGLDVTPTLIGKMKKSGDRESADALTVIYRDEIGHVRAGQRWFHYLCDRDGRAPRDAWQALVRQYFKGDIKPPFNLEGRNQAGLPYDFYAPLAGQ